MTTQTPKMKSMFGGRGALFVARVVAMIMGLAARQIAAAR